ncbi:unnamed protein product [Prorocentrum cordatum]|uniref:Uncharacterized protein n=1 Tax=Prorocentrum cordatum TaxID=2364126 RepID=A0ABN9X349_9DINO|nr:unnamed protein product [Polarella glacialis]
MARFAALDPRYPALLARAEATATVVTNASLEPWEASLSSQLCYVMVMLFRNAAQDKMSTVPPGEGLEARRQAILDWGPKVRTRKVGLLIKMILTAKFSGDIAQSLDQLEHLVRECEGQAGQPFDGDLKIGIVIVNMVDATVQQHLVKNSARLETWMAMKEELLDMARTEQYLNSQPKPDRDEVSHGFLLPMLPALETDRLAALQGPKRVMVDAGAGASVCPTPFDAAAAADASVMPATLATATGEEVRLRDGRRSHLQAADGAGVALRCSSSEQVTVPAVSALDACSAGNWLVFGPGVQKVISSRDARGLRRAARATPGLDTGRGRGVCWLELWDEQPAGETRPLCPAKAAKKVLTPPKIPLTVTQAEWDSHQLTHLPFRSRCDHCASGKATEGPHAQQEPEAEGAVPKICVDYLFLTSKTDEQEMHAVLNVLDAKSGGPFPGMVNQKGEDDYALALMSEAVHFCGRTNMLLLSDGERPINRLIDVFIETRSSKHSASKRNTPKESSQSAGLIERSNYEDYFGEIVEFGECVHHKSPLSSAGKADDRWHLGVWLGKSMRADEHLVGASRGVLTRRSIWRRPEQQRWNKQLLDAFVGSPWEPVPPAARELPEGPPKPRDVYITQRPLHQHRPHHCEHQRTQGGPEVQREWLRSHTQQQELPRPPVEAPDHEMGEEDDGPSEKRSRTIAGLPTLHEPGLVVAAAGTAVAYLCSSMVGRDPEVAPINVDWSKEYFSTKAGVREGKIKEMRNIDACEVKQDIPWSEARKQRLNIVNAKWVLEPKPSGAGSAAARARLAATEVNTCVREDVTQSTPPVKVFRIIASLAASKQRSDGTWASYGVSVAFFHAESTGKTAVTPPADVGKEGFVWLLRKAMHGTREASKQFGTYVIKALTEDGFVMIMVVPMVFVHCELDVSLGCRGGDFQAEAEKEALDELDKIMQRHFEVMIPPRIGPPERGGQAAELKHFERTIRWTSCGFEWEGYLERITSLMELQGLQPGSPRGMTTPSWKVTGKGDRDIAEPLGTGPAQVFRTAARALQYLAEDVPSVKFTTSTVVEGMTTPTKMHALRLHRCVRYLLDHPSEIWIFAHQKMPTHLTEHCDSDWAADKETRKSMSCVDERLGEHLIDMSVSKQSLLALSSGEAESYAIVRGAAMGVQTTQIIEAMTRMPCKLAGEFPYG